MEKKIDRVLRIRGLDRTLKGTWALKWCVEYIVNTKKGTVQYLAWKALAEYAQLLHVGVDVVWRRIVLALTMAGTAMDPIEAIEQLVALVTLEGLKYES